LACFSGKSVLVIDGKNMMENRKAKKKNNNNGKQEQ
jgi:hypothetical protein